MESRETGEFAHRETTLYEQKEVCMYVCMYVCMTNFQMTKFNWFQMASYSYNSILVVQNQASPDSGPGQRIRVSYSYNSILLVSYFLFSYSVVWCIRNTANAGFLLWYATTTIKTTCDRMNHHKSYTNNIIIIKHYNIITLQYCLSLTYKYISYVRHSTMR